VAVVVEHGEHGGAAAAPIAGRVLRAYFEGKGVIAKPVRHDAPDTTADGEPTAAEPAEKPAVKAD
jgi:penicillin-binding protein 2